MPTTTPETYLEQENRVSPLLITQRTHCECASMCSTEESAVSSCIESLLLCRENRRAPTRTKSML